VKQVAIIGHEWYEYVPQSAVETHKLLWDMNIQCDYVIEARRPD